MQIITLLNALKSLFTKKTSGAITSSSFFPALDSQGNVTGMGSAAELANVLGEEMGLRSGIVNVSNGRTPVISHPTESHCLFLLIGHEDPSKFIVMLRGGTITTISENQSSPTIYGVVIEIHNTMGASCSRQSGSFFLQNIPTGLSKIRYYMLPI